MTLSTSDLINVQVSLTPQPARQPNISTLLIVGWTDVIDTTERARFYTTLSGVATDFANTTGEYLAASLWFGQNPQTTSLIIGRWASVATSGRLIGGLLPPANQIISTWTAITTGAFNVTVDGAAHTATGMNFSGATNLNGVASIIQTRLLAAGAVVGTTVVWNAVYQRFEIKSGTTGTSSSVSFLGTPGSGVDISNLLLMRSTSTSFGAYVSDGMAAEPVLNAVEALDNQFGTRFYGIKVIGTSDANLISIAAFIEADSPKHFLWVTTSEAGATSSVDTSNIAYLLKNLNYSKTAVQYSNTLFTAVSAASRILTTAWTQPNSTITLMYKVEPGVVAENLNENQAQALAANNCNVFVNYENGSAILQYGVCSSGQFIDTVIGADWFAGRIQTNVFNLLYTTLTKIPQTDIGSNMIANVIEQACEDMVNNGWLAPGTWNSNGIGQIKPGDFLPKGYYVYYPPVATQNESDRARRISVPFTVLAKLAGAVHTVDVSVLVNP